jgi:hypothetical protein
VSIYSKSYVTLMAAMLLAGAPPTASALSTGFDLPACAQLSTDEPAPAPKMGAIKLDSTGTPKSPAPDTILDRARSVNLLPPALVPDEKEQRDVQKLMTESERNQLEALWSATIQRSQEIQFVIDRLQPHSDAHRDNSLIVRTIGGVLQGAMNAAPYVAPAGLPRLGMGAGGSMLGGIINGHDAKGLQKAQVSREQLIVLYKMVQDTADKLVRDYREYRKARNEYSRAMISMQDAQALSGAIDEKGKMQQYFVDFTLRLARRDVERAEDQMRTTQQQLADLAGTDAVAKLNGQVDEEQMALQNLVGGSEAAAAPLKLQPAQTAAGHGDGVESPRN